ncbi:MAG: phenylacetate--CoA ligase family protein [Paludibacteraceae bacterium]|nr:phenylacetate--CoA ligase family protein [Paludibacteraceae bacterium]
MSKVKEKILLNIVLPMAEAVKCTNASYWYRQITEMNTWSREQITAWQNSRLQKLVRHAYDHTIYYRNLFDSLALKPEDIQTADDLQKLPILTKDIIHVHFDELKADNLSLLKYRKGRTGGTTGEPMNYLCDEDVWGYVTANKIYSWRKLGYRFGDKFVALGSASILAKKPSFSRRVLDIIRNEVALNSMNMDEQLCLSYIQKIKDENIRFVYGYASSVYLLAATARRHNIDMTHIEGAYTTSENLTDTYRKVIEETFGCRVMDCYGARDAGVTAYEIHRGYFDLGYMAIAEVVDEFEPNKGIFLSTNLLNLSMPLLRYQFGDVVELSSNNQYNGQILTQVLGRCSDVLRLDNGHVLTSPGFTILMNNFDVVAYEIHKIDGAHIKMQIQPADKFNKQAEERLIAEMKRFVGEGCDFQLEYVSHFEPLPNGKRRYFMVDDKKNDDMAAKENGRFICTIFVAYGKGYNKKLAA